MFEDASTQTPGNNSYPKMQSMTTSCILYQGRVANLQCGQQDFTYHAHKSSIRYTKKCDIIVEEITLFTEIKKYILEKCL